MAIENQTSTNWQGLLTGVIKLNWTAIDSILANSKQNNLPPMCLDTCVVIDLIENPRRFLPPFLQIQEYFRTGITPTVLLELNNKFRQIYLQEKYDLLNFLGLEMFPFQFPPYSDFEQVTQKLRMPAEEISIHYCDICIGFEVAQVSGKILLTNNRQDSKIFYACGANPIGFYELVHKIPHYERDNS